MPKARAKHKAAQIAAFCDLERRSFPIAISDITPDGCSALAPAGWDGDCDFIHLTIADKVEINGRVLWQKGKRASIAFFGQIHPHVVDELGRLAA